MSSLKFYYPDGRVEGIKKYMSNWVLMSFYWFVNFCFFTCFSTFCFLELDEDAYAVLPYTNEHSQPQLIQHMTTRSNMKHQFNSGASSKTWGLSLNERILGANSNPCNADKYGPEPSFNLFGEETPGSSNKTNSSAARTNSFSSQMGTVSTHTSPDCVGGFRTISPTHQNKSNSAQLIFSTAYENQFYNLIKSFAGKLESRCIPFLLHSELLDTILHSFFLVISQM